MCPEKGFIVVFSCRFSSCWQSTGLIRGWRVQLPQAAPQRKAARTPSCPVRNENRDTKQQGLIHQTDKRKEHIASETRRCEQDHSGYHLGPAGQHHEPARRGYHGQGERDHHPQGRENHPSRPNSCPLQTANWSGYDPEWKAKAEQAKTDAVAQVSASKRATLWNARHPA